MNKENWELLRKSIEAVFKENPKCTLSIKSEETGFFNVSFSVFKIEGK